MAANTSPGTIIQAAANGYAMICIGRVVGGVGNGMVRIHQFRQDLAHS
jgi:predicted MFS family arabinose efflux permease